MVAKIRERLAISKQAIQKCDVEGVNPRKLNDLEARKQNQINLLALEFYI
jgi:hypothetical protein